MAPGAGPIGPRSGYVADVTADVTADDRALLALADLHLRREAAPPVGWTREATDRIVRFRPPPGVASGPVVLWSDLDESTADAAVAEQVAWFTRDGREAEWKVYGHDLPADLPERLRAAGLQPDEEEALVVGDVADVVRASGAAALPAGVTLRRFAPGDDLSGILTLKTRVYGGDWQWLVEELAAELAADPAAVTVLAALADGEVVSAGWARYPHGDFAGLWGGATLPAWRRRGIYRALVAVRAREAAERGYPYLQVDASPRSRPILERLGMRVLTTTTPWTWTPSAP
jgi:GNAT superfamily N-acetyltransferase